jgi:hypothetical protein
MKAMRKSFLFASILWLFFLSIPLAALPTLSWREEFTDNGDKWTVGDTEDYKYEISGGVYSMTGKKGGRWGSHGFPIRRDSDFILDVKIKSDSSVSTDYAGLIWDFKDKDHYYQFLVAQHGKYSILRMENGKANFIVPWTASSVVNGRGIYNLLRVAREGKNLLFFINKIQVKSIPYESYSGGNIGFSFSGTQTISVDSVVLQEERIMNGEEVRLPSLRATVFESRLNEKNQSWLVSSGKISGQFTDAGNGAGYLLKHSARGSIDILSKEFSLDKARDFFVEAEIEWISGDEGYSYGLACDVIGRDYLWFGLTSNGFYSIVRTVGGVKKELVPWTISDNIFCYEAKNRLSVYRRGSNLIFAINRRKVYETAYEAWSSGRIGIGSGGAMSIRPSFLGVYQSAIAEGPIHGSCTYGWGAYRYADGSVHVGFWERGKPNGFGTRYSPGLSVQEGWWKEGSLRAGTASTGRSPGSIYFPVMTSSGDIGLVNSWGEEEGFGLKGVVYFDRILQSPIPQAEEGRIGFRDSGGKLWFSPKWTIASPFSHGYALVKGPKGETGIVDELGELTVPLGAYEILPGQDLARGVARIKETRDGKALYGLIGVDGTLLIPPSLLGLDDFYEGYAQAKSLNGFYGFVDLLGVWRIKPDYDGVGNFSEGLAYAFYEDYIPWEEYIYPSGAVAFDLDGRDLYPLYPYKFSEGLLVCADLDDAAVFLASDGEVYLEAGAWTEALPFSEGLAAVKGDSGWAYIDDAGQMAIEGPYRQASSFSQGLAAVRIGDRWGYIDQTGQLALPALYLEAHSFAPEGFAQVKLASGAWTWVDWEGNLLWPGR